MSRVDTFATSVDRIRVDLWKARTCIRENDDTTALMWLETARKKLMALKAELSKETE